MDGSIESWDKSGHGIVRGGDGNTYLAHFREFKEYKKHQKKIHIEEGQDVSFTPNGKNASDIEYDSRAALYRFAYFPDLSRVIAELARLAQKEKWSSSTFDEPSLRNEITQKAEAEGWLEKEFKHQEGKGFKVDQARAKRFVSEKIENTIVKAKFDVLFSYFERTFERLKLEDKIVKSDTGAAFNTSLGNSYNNDIYAIFKLSTDDRTPYVFERFADQMQTHRQFPKLPEPPNYFVDITTKQRVPSDHLLLDLDLRLVPHDTHLFDERRNRFPDDWKSLNDESCASRFQQLLDITHRRVRRNFRAAIPFYYPALRKIQMLLPITFDEGTENQETHALVVCREGAGYSVNTIMPLPWAYKNARLLAKPDRTDWLDF